MLLNASLPLLHNTNPTLCGFFLAGTFWLNLFHWLVAVLIPGPKMWPCSKPRTMSGDESSGNVTESSICIASRNNRGIPTVVFVRENKAKKKNLLHNSCLHYLLWSQNNTDVGHWGEGATSQCNACAIRVQQTLLHFINTSVITRFAQIAWARGQKRWHVARQLGCQVDTHASRTASRCISVLVISIPVTAATTMRKHLLIWSPLFAQTKWL